MTFIGLLLSSALGKWLVGAFAALLAAAGVYIKGRSDAKAKAEAEQKAKEAASRAEEIDRIKRAAGASLALGVHQDPRNRDNQP